MERKQTAALSVRLLVGASSWALSEAWSMSPAMSSPQREEPPPLAVIGAAALPKVARLGRLLGAVAAFAAGGPALLALRRAMS